MASVSSKDDCLRPSTWSLSQMTKPLATSFKTVTVVAVLILLFLAAECVVSGRAYQQRPTTSGDFADFTLNPCL